MPVDVLPLCAECGQVVCLDEEGVKAFIQHDEHAEHDPQRGKQSPIVIVHADCVEAFEDLRSS